MKQNRYFIAVDVSRQVKLAVEEAQAQLVKDQPGLMQPLQPHITLLDPNILSSVSPMYLLPKIIKLTDDYLPLELVYKSVEKFGDRVVYISVESPELIELRARLLDLLPPSVQAAHSVGREFTPHITVAQAKPKQKLPEGLFKKIQSQLQVILPANQLVSNLTKFTWQAPRSYKAEVIS